MTDWHAPNQQAVGVDPASGGGGSAPPPDPNNPPNGGPFDPAAHTAAEMIAYAADHPEERERLLDAELAGKNRSTVVSALGG